MIIQKKGFTLVELIVVITILAILGTIAFISLQGYSQDANNAKIRSDVKNLTTMIEVNLSKGLDVENLVLSDKTLINWVNTWATIFSGSYILNNLIYEVGTFDFKKFRQNWDDFVYSNGVWDRDYIFWYVKSSEGLFYQFWAQIKNQAWNYDAVIVWNYASFWNSDALWLISESWYDIWVKNWTTLTWSLY